MFSKKEREVGNGNYKDRAMTASHAVTEGPDPTNNGIHNVSRSQSKELSKWGRETANAIQQAGE